MDVSPRQNPAYRPSLSTEATTRRRRIAWSIVLVVYAGAIFALSSFPISLGRALVPDFRVGFALHAAEFAVFYLLARRATGGTGLALVLTAIYAGTDELHQAFVPARTASAIDFGCDLAGGFAAALLRAGIARTRLLGRFRRLILASRESREERGT